MPPRPFPLQISVGTDLQHVVRIRKLISNYDPTRTSTRLTTFMRKFLTFQEQRWFWKRFRDSGADAGPPFKLTPNPEKLEAICKHLSGRWAAKEAVIKAFTWRKISPLQVSIISARNTGPGAPTSSPNFPVYALVTDRPCASFWTTETWAKRKGTSGEDVFPEATWDADDFAYEYKAFAQEVDRDGDNDNDSQAIPEGGIKIRRVSRGGEFIAPYDQHESMDGQIAKVSISHDGDYTTAVCIAAEEPMAGDVGGEAQARAPG